MSVEENGCNLGQKNCDLAEESPDQVKELLTRISRRTLLSLGLLSPLYLSPLKLFLNSAGAVTGNDVKTSGEDGYRAWLRYQEIEDAAVRDSYRSKIKNVFVESDSPTSKVIAEELTKGLSLLLGFDIPLTDKVDAGTLRVSCKAPLPSQLSADAGSDAYVIRTNDDNGSKTIGIFAGSDIGTLYGAFAFLRLLQTHQQIDQLDIFEKAKNPLRILAHWANPDDTIERGYGGKSLWKWAELPERVDSRLIDYARLNASLGLNGVVLNNVNSDPHILDAKNLRKVKALADTFRPYGLKVYVCANWSAPSVLDHLADADPLNPQVIEWWQKKANEIYAAIPDFGGFLVKANSEGIPGPQDYGRTHADGANCLANALAPHGGIVMWRAFVYTVGNQDPDRVKRAYLEFKPLDGKFADNVLVQIKNGPLDFQPREPFHPLFGSMPKTRVMAELQVTQEYTGQSRHLVYLAPCWKEVLEANTYGNGANSAVAKIIETVPKPGSGGFSAGANTGSDRNWCGHHFAQANWFAYGRLAWDSDLTAQSIADQWIKMTWSNSPKVVECIRDIMLKSYEAYVDYTMPLGLHHMVGGDHFAPLPEGEGDPRGIFHHASADGIGYDRTRAGSDAVDEYHAPLNDRFNDPKTCPEKYLLWFHHLPWQYRMASGRTLWQELCSKYDTGIKVASEMEKQWSSLASQIDGQRHQEVAAKLQQQAKDAEKWSDKCLSYFSQYSKMPRA